MSSSTSTSTTVETERLLRSENARLQSKLDEFVAKTEKLLREEAANIDEKIQMQHSMLESDEQIVRLHSQLQQQSKIHQDEWEQREAFVRLLQGEKRDTEAQLEELQRTHQEEVKELQATVAALQAELSVQSRELASVASSDQTRQRQINDLSAHLEAKGKELDAMQAEKVRIEVDKSRLIDKLAANEAQMSNINAAMANLEKEKALLKETLDTLSEKYKHGNETSAQLNHVLVQMKSTIQELTTQRNQEMVRAESFQSQSKDCEQRQLQIETQFTEMRAKVMQYETEKMQASFELKKSNESIAKLQVDLKTLQTKTSRLEKDQQTLLADQINRSKDLEETRCQLEEALREVDFLRDDSKRLSAITSQLEPLPIADFNTSSEKLLLEAEIVQLKDQNTDHTESILSLSQQLTEAEKMLETVQFQNREQNRAAEAAISDLSVKNNKLVSDNCSLKEKINTIQASLELQERKASQSAIDSEKNFHEKLEPLSCRIQELEDINEELNMKLTSRQGEIESLKEQVLSADQRYKLANAQLTLKFEAEISSLQTKLSGAKDLELQLVSATSNLKDFSAVMTKTKDSYESQIADMRAQFQRQSNATSERISKLTAEVSDLEGQLHTELKKNRSLTTQLQENRMKLFGAPLDGPGRVNSSGTPFGTAKVSDLEERIQQLSEQEQRQNMFASTLQQQLANERQGRLNALQRLRESESTVGNLQQQLNSSRGDNAKLRKQIIDDAEKYATNLSAKDVELQRLAKRNEVLTDMIDRLSKLIPRSVLAKGFAPASEVEPAPTDDSPGVVSDEDNNDDEEYDDAFAHIDLFNKTRSAAHKASRVKSAPLNRTSLESLRSSTERPTLGEPVEDLRDNHHARHKMRSAPPRRVTYAEPLSNSNTAIMRGSTDRSHELSKQCFEEGPPHNDSGSGSGSGSGSITISSPSRAASLQRVQEVLNMHKQSDTANDINGSRSSYSSKSANLRLTATATPLVLSEEPDGHGNIHNTGSAVASGSASFTQKVRGNVESGKEMQLPFSPSAKAQAAASSIRENLWSAFNSAAAQPQQLSVSPARSSNPWV